MVMQGQNATTGHCCYYQKPGCGFFFLKLLLLMLALLVAFVAGSIVTKLDEKDFSKLTFGVLDKVLPKKPDALKVDPNDEVLKRLSTFEADLRFTIRGLKSGIDGLTQSPPINTTKSSDRNSSDSVSSQDYSSYRIAP